MDLDTKKCVPCEGGTPMSNKEAKTLLSKIHGWNLTNKKIEREFLFSDFKQSINFVNKVAKIAEKEGHHPDICIHWNKVTITLWTHSINGLSENDFIIASKINKMTGFSKNEVD
jgi:4a-hydroxytetrahydrobiopterin dehydratase